MDGKAPEAFDELAISIHKPVPFEGWKRIFNECWKQGLDDQRFRESYTKYSAYFQQYERQCQQCSINQLGQLRHYDILKAVVLMLTQTKSSCVQALEFHLSTLSAPFIQPSCADDFVQEWIRFTARSLLLVDVSKWSGNDTLETFLKTQLAAQPTQIDRMKLPQSFHLRNLDKITGVKVRWTNVLSEHLSLEKDDTQVAIFHQRYALTLFRNSTLLPDDFFDETRQTLNLLLPRFQPGLAKWFRQHCRKCHIDVSVAESSSLDKEQRKIESFKYWGDRLMILKEGYDAHEPQNIAQYWYDDRKPAQWWAFWAALAIFVFAITQVVEGAIQCYKAYHPT